MLGLLPSIKLDLDTLQIFKHWLPAWPLPQITTNGYLHWPPTSKGRTWNRQDRMLWHILAGRALVEPNYSTQH